MGGTLYSVIEYKVEDIVWAYMVTCRRGSITNYFVTKPLRYDDKINDVDFISKIKFSLKGVNSMGNKSNNTISKQFRALHPSMLGRTDINVIGNSDPGTSGTLVPWIETDGLYLSDKHDDEGFIYTFEKDLNIYIESCHGASITIEYENEDDYFNGENRKRRSEVMRGIIISDNTDSALSDLENSEWTIDI